MTTTMMIVTEDQLVVVEGEPRGEEVEEPVRGVPEVEVEVRMRVGRGGLVMVHSPHHSFRSCWRQMMAILGLVRVVDKLLFERLDLPPRTQGDHFIPARNPKDRHAVSS
jgi:hypothetical protein